MLLGLKLIVVLILKLVLLLLVFKLLLLLVFLFKFVSVLFSLSSTIVMVGGRSLAGSHPMNSFANRSTFYQSKYVSSFDFGFVVVFVFLSFWFILFYFFIFGKGKGGMSAVGSAG